MEISIKPNPACASQEARNQILAAPGFGKFFTDHMVSATWSQGRGWHDAQVMPYGPIAMDPASAVLHYAQEIFEGLKAYRWPDGSIVSFRPQANAARMQASAHRLAMPELSEELFLASLRELIAVDEAWVPAAGGEAALYLRPFAIATESGLGVRPAKQYRYLVIASPAGAWVTVASLVAGATIRPTSLPRSSSRDGIDARAFTPSASSTTSPIAPPTISSLSLVLANSTAIFAAETGSVEVARAVGPVSRSPIPV